MNTTSHDQTDNEKRHAAFRKLVEELQVRHADGTIKTGADVKRLLGQFTASVWPAMKPQAKQLEPVKKTIADVASDYWTKQREQAQAHRAASVRQQPASEPAERPKGVVSVDADAVLKKWNSHRKAGNLNGVAPAPVRGVR
jgi:hypothetical protein